MSRGHVILIKWHGSTPVHTWHRCQLCGHVTLCTDLLPGGCGKMKAPKLSEKRVVFIFWSACLLKVWVVSPKHIQVGAVSNTAVSASRRGHAVSCGTFSAHKIFESLMQLEITDALIFSNTLWIMLFSSNIGLSHSTTNSEWQTKSTWWVLQHSRESSVHFYSSSITESVSEVF